MEQFYKGDLILYKWSNLHGRQIFYLVTRGNKFNHGAEFIQIRRATKDGKFDKRFSNYSHTGLVKNFVLIKRAQELAFGNVKNQTAQMVN